MNWKLKSFIQRSCSSLPAGQEPAYYFLQRTFGSLRFPPEPMPSLLEVSRIAGELRELGFSLEGKRVMEVGTGRRLDMPIGFFLLGAASTDTFDLHRYMRGELVMKSIGAMVRKKTEIIEHYKALTDPDSLRKRLMMLENATSTADVLKIAGINYHAPADAGGTGLPEQCIDLQFSYTVFEHIPRPTLRDILLECNRVLTKNGLACHHIDPSDHFAHDDASISLINFRRFNPEEWSKYNDNQFAYHNRLAVTDYEQLYSEVNHEIVAWKTWRDERSRKELAEGFPLAAEYREIPADVLTTVVVRATTRPRRKI